MAATATVDEAGHEAHGQETHSCPAHGWHEPVASVENSWPIGTQCTCSRKVPKRIRPCWQGKTSVFLSPGDKDSMQSQESSAAQQVVSHSAECV